MNKNQKLSYMDSVHRDGRIWGVIVCLLILAFPAVVSLVFKTSFCFKDFWLRLRCIGRLVLLKSSRMYLC